MKRLLVYSYLLIIFAFIAIIHCEKKPTEPERDNPLDVKNVTTVGDPFNLTCAFANGGVKLTWTKVGLSSIKGYNIYRSESQETGYTQIHQALNTYTFTDKAVKNGHVYYYKITAFLTNGQENNQSNIEAVRIHTDPLIVINSDEQYSAIRNVELTIIASDAKEMWLCNNDQFTEGNWESYNSLKDWTLSTGEGTKNVYLKIKYENDEVSNISSDNILPLPMQPSVKIANDSVYTSRRDVSVLFSATGENLFMQVSQDSGFTNVSWEEYTTSKNMILPAGDGTKTVYAKFKNDFEIESATISDDILPQPMKPEIIISDGSTYTSTRETVLNLKATGENLYMKVSQDSGFTNVSWEEYTTSKNMTLPDGDGAKTVYAKFKNDFEIESNIISNSIILDMTGPIADFSVTPTIGVANVTFFEFDATNSYDNFSLMLRWDWDNDGNYDTDWWTIKTATQLFQTGGGDRTVGLQVKDGAGHTAHISKSVYVNTYPVASFTVSWDENTYLLYHVDASFSSDYEDGKNLEYRWDWNNDGIWDTHFSSNKIIAHQYSSEGNKIVKLEVRDTKGLTHSTVKQLSEPFTVTDIDGNTYKVVKIGNQWWMAENLKVTHYGNGDAIPKVIEEGSWYFTNSGAYCIYDNNDENASTYGCLYNWYAVYDTRKVAPDGWHVPNDEEWNTLIDYLGGSEIAGGKMKEAGTVHWQSPNTGATNESGFSAVPSGYRTLSGSEFLFSGQRSYYWSATNAAIIDARNFSLNYRSAEIYNVGSNKKWGFSVRCIRD